jgi:hypothetical protein
MTALGLVRHSKFSPLRSPLGKKLTSARQINVRFTPESGHGGVSSDVRFVP